MKGYLLLGLILIGIPLLIFGINQVPPSCQCTGIGGTYCIGTIVCEEETIDCIPLTCENKHEFLGVLDIEETTNKAYTILIIDASKSMEGDNLDATIAASKEFVKKIGEQEYIAIIEFNEKAQILIEFTNDKLKLFNSIDLIMPKSRTRFYEPFNLANNMFDKVPQEANKYILFLSDGAPEDEEEEFMNEVNTLKKNDVNIYTLAFSGKSNEELMEQIASKKTDIFTVTTSQDIEQKFSEVYANIAEERDLYITTTQETNVLKTSEYLQLELKSIHNDVNVFSQNKYCELKSSQYIEAKKNNQQFSRITGEIKNEKIRYPLQELETGEYTITTYTKIKLGECILSATKQIETTIIKDNDCQVSCEDIHSAMKKNKTSTYQRNKSIPVSWNILIDKSSSMDANRHLERAIQDTKTITSFLPVQDTISIGSFDTKTDLISIHKKGTHYDESELQTIVSSSSTQLITALQKFQQLEANSPSPNIHHIIITDGNYLEEHLEKINRSLQQIQGCITTINYGTHLLTKKEKAFELIKKNRKCGVDFITRPTNEEYQELVGTTQKDTPELILLFGANSQNSITPTTLSSFSGEEPQIYQGNCLEKPTITTTITRENKTVEVFIDETFNLDKNDSYSSIATFGNSNCKYTAIKKYEMAEPIKENNTIKIIGAVLIVLIINLVVFTIVMDKKLKKLERFFKRK